MPAARRTTTMMIERFMMLRVYAVAGSAARGSEVPARQARPVRRTLLLAVAAAAAGVARVGRGAIRAARAAALRRRDDRDVRVLQRRLLQALELDHRAPVAQDCLQLVVLRGGEIAL